MREVTVEELAGDPHPLLARLREREPVAWLPALGGWLVTRRDLALAVMRDPETFTVDDPRFSTGRVVGPSMLTLDGAEHDRHRAPFARPFRKDAVRNGFSQLVADTTERLLDVLEPRARAELRTEFAGPLATVAVTHALGLEDTEASTVRGWYDAIVDSVTTLTAGGDATASGRAAVADLRKAVDSALDSEDLGLEPGEVASNAAVLLFGGIETTEGMIANAVLHLLEHPSELELVRREPALLLNAIEESLRLEPAAATVDRYATRDVRLGGADIRRGDLVTISIAGANRDPAAFEEPDRFDVRRDNAGRHLAFAHGPHVCIGMHLARLEAHTAVGRLLERLPGLRLEEPAAPRGLVFRKPPELRVTWAA